MLVIDADNSFIAATFKQGGEMSNTEKSAQHYGDMLKAQLFAEVVQALRDLVESSSSTTEITATLAAIKVLEKIDSNELLRS